MVLTSDFSVFYLLTTNSLLVLPLILYFFSDYFGALGGSLGATMAMGYRHLYGRAVPRSCEAALLYYEIAANAAVATLAQRSTNVTAAAAVAGDGAGTVDAPRSASRRLPRQAAAPIAPLSESERLSPRVDLAAATHAEREVATCN